MILKCRTKNGVLPPLAARATLAAWPSRGADDISRTNSSAQTTPSIQTNNQRMLWFYKQLSFLFVFLKFFVI